MLLNGYYSGYGQRCLPKVHGYTGEYNDKGEEFLLFQRQFRGGSQQSRLEKKTFNELSLSILRENGIIWEKHKDYDWIRKRRGVGYAVQYLRECWNETEMVNHADVSIYRQLIDIDSKLGTTSSEQLTNSLAYTTRSDIIKV